MKGLFSGLVEDSSRSFILSFVVGSLLAAGSSPRARSEVIHLQVHTGSRKYYHKTWPDMKCFCGYFFSRYANGLLSTLKLCFWFLSLSLAFTNLLQRFSFCFRFNRISFRAGTLSYAFMYVAKQWLEGRIRLRDVLCKDFCSKLEWLSASDHFSWPANYKDSSEPCRSGNCLRCSKSHLHSIPRRVQSHFHNYDPGHSQLQKTYRN